MLLPLVTLERTDNSILYELPPGKPDPNQKCTVGEESRTRVLQSGVKGACCWDYTFNLIRPRIGKHPDKELLKERFIEKICSQRRKELTAYDDAFPISITELYLQSTATLLEKFDLEKAQLFLKDPDSSLCCFSAILDDRSNIIPYIQEFIKEKKHKNMYEFLIFKRSCKSIELNLKFLNHFPTDIDKMIEDENWKKWDIERKAAALDIYVRDFSADLYQLKKSSWQPLNGIEKLINELQTKGPLMILGDFGPSAYIDLPFIMNRQIAN